MSDEQDLEACKKSWAEYNKRHGYSDIYRWAVFGDGFDRGVEYARSVFSSTERKLNPYNDPQAVRPDDPRSLFIFRIRYYAGMLDDDDNWSHSLGHIEESCIEFKQALNTRNGDIVSQPVEPTSPTNAELVETIRGSLSKAAHQDYLRDALDEVERRLATVLV